MYSVLRTGPQLILKVGYETDPEKIIGYANGLSFTVVQGQKSIYTVDSPFPQEIAQSAGPSFVRGTVSLYCPAGSDPVRLGLVPPANLTKGDNSYPYAAGSRYLHWRIYDRNTGEMALAVNFVKVISWSMSAMAKSVVRIQLDFEGMYFESGTA